MLNKYSVVIPAYNAANTIDKAVKSVIEQSRYDLIDEIIIVNDGSTDETEDKIKELQSSCDKIILIMQDNKGAAVARNTGIKETRNNFVALLDADDIWNPKKIEKQNSIFEEYPRIQALGTNRIGEIVQIGEKFGKGIYRISPKEYCIKCWPCTPSLVFNKNIFDNNEWFPTDMTHAEEGIFFLHLAATAGLYYIEDALVECGNGKRAFGESGLSGNLLAMHNGIKEMLIKACEKNYISNSQRKIFTLYENMKYIRRLLISRKKAD